MRCPALVRTFAFWAWVYTPYASDGSTDPGGFPQGPFRTLPWLRHPLQRLCRRQVPRSSLASCPHLSHDDTMMCTLSPVPCEPSLLSVSGQCSSVLTLCIVPMFLLSQSINRGGLRSAGVSRFIAKPLRLHWPPSLAPAASGLLLLRWSTILGYYPLDPGCFTKNLWAFPRLAWLLHRRCQARCCLRPRGAGQHSSISHFPYRLRLVARDRHNPKITLSRG